MRYEGVIHQKLDAILNLLSRMNLRFHTHFSDDLLLQRPHKPSLVRGVQVWLGWRCGPGAGGGAGFTMRVAPVAAAGSRAGLNLPVQCSLAVLCFLLALRPRMLRCPLPVSRSLAGPAEEAT